MADWEYIPKHMRASYALLNSSERYANRMADQAAKLTNKLERMAILLQENRLGAARRLWNANKQIRCLVPTSVQRILFP